ncbi:hypothetical protein M1N49_01450 [Thermodesulfovibrionales bacterium]|nr:hypothetical protein [Thermodesulfovibrionales bacterium]MCL0072335.1 hypothetical protein [Thermodesulfovibrionales bacterium]MCL0086473.1 hypothetical protein [Thermodesulfovibrionales bacterium]
MSKDGVVHIFKQFSDRRLLDTRIVNLLFENYEEIFSYVAEKQAAAKDFYEKQFSFRHQGVM